MGCSYDEMFLRKDFIDISADRKASFLHAGTVIPQSRLRMLGDK